MVAPDEVLVQEVCKSFYIVLENELLRNKDGSCVYCGIEKRPHADYCPHVLASNPLQNLAQICQWVIDVGHHHDEMLHYYMEKQRGYKWYKYADFQDNLDWHDPAPCYFCGSSPHETSCPVTSAQLLLEKLQNTQQTEDWSEML